MYWITESVFFFSYLSGVLNTKNSEMRCARTLLWFIRWSSHPGHLPPPSTLPRTCPGPCPGPCPRSSLRPSTVSWLRLFSDRGSLRSVCHSHSSLSVLACNALFTRCGSALLSSITSFWISGFLSPGNHPSRCSRLSVTPFATLLFELCQLTAWRCLWVRQSRSASADLTPPVQCEASVSPRSWLSQRAARSSTCWPTCSTPHALSRAARGLVDSQHHRQPPPRAARVEGVSPELGWPPCPRHGRGFRRAACWSTFARRWERLVAGASASKVCTANGDPHLSSGFALLCFPRSCTRLLWFVVFRSGLRAAVPPKLSLCDSPQPSPLRLALCLMVSGHFSTQTCLHWLTGLHVQWSLFFFLSPRSGHDFPSWYPFAGRSSRPGSRPSLVRPFVSASSAASGRCSRISPSRGCLSAPGLCPSHLWCETESSPTSPAGWIQWDPVPATHGYGLHPSFSLASSQSSSVIFSLNFFNVSSSPWELDVYTATSSTVGFSCCGWNWASCSVAPEGTIIEFGAVSGPVMCRIVQHIHGASECPTTLNDPRAPCQSLLHSQETDQPQKLSGLLLMPSFMPSGWSSSTPTTLQFFQLSCTLFRASIGARSSDSRAPCALRWPSKRARNSNSWAVSVLCS